jgi:hypothetical protein
MEQRVLSSINALPPKEREEARREFEEAKPLFAQLQGLPPEERRAKMHELMANQGVAERMAERRMLRDSNLTAQQRISRAVNYLSRKASMKAGGVQ